jgi:signal transduction histidine kinase
MSGEEELGRLLVEPMPSHPLRPVDLRMLKDLAHQTTTAFSNVRLSAELAARVEDLSRSTADLQASRRRLIEARDQECARIERAVSRDVLPHLEPLPSELSRLAEASSPRLDESLDAMADAAVTALEALREITHGVFPTQLARAGLRAAVASHLSRSADGGQVTIDEAAAPLRFGSRTESAAYFCFIEASRSLAPPIEVRIAAPDGHLLLTVSGRHSDGVSPAQMSDRVEAVGGSVSTRRIGDRSVIDVDLPVAESHAAAGARTSAVD